MLITASWSPFADLLNSLRVLWQDAGYRIPLIIVWFASFGGALGAPAAPFYYAQLGASDLQIGTIVSIATGGALLFAPVYGTLLDRRAAFPSLCLSMLLCSVGCLVRAAAMNVTHLYVGALILGLGGNLSNLVVSFVVSSVEASQRSRTLAALIGMEQAVGLAGRALFPLIHYLLDRTALGAKATAVAVQSHAGAQHIRPTYPVTNVTIATYSGQIPLSPADADARLLARYRISISICPFFCVVGLFIFLWNRNAMQAKLGNYGLVRRQESDESQEDDETEPFVQQTNTVSPRSPVTHRSSISPIDCNQYPSHTSVVDTDTPIAGEVDTGDTTQFTATSAIIANEKDALPGLFHVHGVLTFVLLSSAWFALSSTNTLTLTLWPLIMRDRLKWGASAYAGLSILRSVVFIVALACFPVYESALGRFRAPLLALLGAAMAVLITFSQTAFSIPVVHVLLSLVFFACCALAEAALKVVATAFLPLRLQGVSWGFLATLQGLGGIVGSSAGTAMYQYSKDFAGEGHGIGQVLVQELPFVASCVMLLMAGGLVKIAQCTRSALLDYVEDDDPILVSFRSSPGIEVR